MTDLERETLHELRSLVRSPGWARLVKIGEAQIEIRKAQELCTDIYLEEDRMIVQKLKEERRAIEMFFAIPDSMIESIELEESDDADTET